MIVASEGKRESVFVRVNQVGYLPEDSKVAVAFSEGAVRGMFIVHESGRNRPVFRGKLKKADAPGWGNFSAYYYLDFSEIKKEGRYYITVEGTGDRSAEFGIGRGNSYTNYHEDLLGTGLGRTG